MGKIDEYLDRAKGLAGDAGEVAKNIKGEVVSKAKELTAEGSKVRELTQSAKDQTAAITLGAREKVQGVLQDAKAVKEIKQGIIELESLPEFEGSILYTMELESMKNNLNSLLLIISDNRLDDASVVEEIKKAMGKVQPAGSAVPEAPETAGTQGEGEASVLDGPVTYEPVLDEQHAIDKAKVVAYSACVRALATLNATER